MKGADQQQLIENLKPSGAFVGASYGILGLNLLLFIVGLWNAAIATIEAGFYFSTLCFGLFAAVSVQRAVRDKKEGLNVSAAYMGISYTALALAVLLMTVALWNSPMELSERGFYAVTFAAALFSAITIQKNVRDEEAVNAILTKTNKELNSVSTE